MSGEIQIYQNQAVNFTDTSSGGQPPLSRLWNFQGGSIASATGATATVFYTNPGQYNVSLTITDSLSTTKTLVETNLINVSSSFIIADFTGTPTATILMSTLINFVDASTGEPQGPTAWAWNIQGDSYSSQNVSFTGFDDWFAIGGVPGNAPGEIISVSAQLTASNGALSDVEVKDFAVTKIGAVETTFINTRGNPFYVNDSIFTIEMSGAVPLVTSDIPSYSGSDIVYKLATNNLTQPLTGFHTTTENVLLTYSGGINPIDTGLNVSTGYLIVDNFLYNSGFPQIMDGQYITPDIVPGITDLYFTSSQLDNAYSGIYDPGGNYAYSLPLIEDVVNSLYPQTNSGQAVSFGKTFETNEVYSTNEYPVVISPIGVSAVSGLTGSYNINLTVNYVSGSPQTAFIQFNANGGMGNEIGGAGSYYVMQDTAGPLLGVASMINLGISTGISGGTGTIEAFASPIYNTNISGGLTTDYNGLSLKIKSFNVSSISITDNSQALTVLVGGLIIIPPFGFSPTSPSPTTCTGILMDLDISSYVSSFGTQLNYGGSIF